MTPEEIAREAAEDAVTMEESEGGVTRTLSVGAYLVSVYSYEHDLTNLRAEVAKIVLAAVERALREVPCGSPVSDERLEQIREENDESDTAWTDSGARHVIDQLLAHADHLARVLQDCAADGLLSRRQEIIDAAFRAGFAAGAEAQRDDCAESVRRFALAQKYRYPGEGCVAAVEATPLAGPPA